MDILRAYQGPVGMYHDIRDSVKERYTGLKDSVHTLLSRQPQPPKPDYDQFQHLKRRKTTLEMFRVSSAVMGIEFSYAAETAFVTPTLLEIGVKHSLMTMIWALSPLIGFFVTPLLGSLSDRCTHPYGRRRLFILLLSTGVFMGLILVPNGKIIGEKLGDTDMEHTWGVIFTVLGTVLLDFNADACQNPARAYLLDVSIPEDHARGLSTFTVAAGLGGFMGYSFGGLDWDSTWIGDLLGGHVRAVFTLVTVIFVVCITLTVTSFKEMPLNLVKKNENILMENQIPPSMRADERNELKLQDKSTYGTIETKFSNSKELGNGICTTDQIEEESETKDSFANGITSTELGDKSGEGKPSIKEKDIHVMISSVEETATPSLKEYLMSIIYMPTSLRILCVTNLFSWMAHICYSLYFTDYVGEAIFGGDPKAAEGSEAHTLYTSGVRFGCFGMAMYSLSCACYSLIIEKLINRFKARRVYVGGLLFFGGGMLLMGVTKSKVGVICFSGSAGVMYSTLFTIPYLLVAHYHSRNMFGEISDEKMARGLGTDISIVGSMVFLAQFILSLCMGSIISLAGTTTVVVLVSGCLSIFGAFTAWYVLYLDL